MTDPRERSDAQPTLEARRPILALWVGLAVGAGVLLRLDGLDRKSLWLDEVMTFRSISMPTVAGMLQDVEASLPSLYFLVVRGWTWVWGLSDVSLRSLPALLGVLSLPVTYFVWRPLIGHDVASWATIFLALNAYHIEYSQDGKMYIAIWLLATVSSGAFLNAVLREGPSRPAWLVLYGLTNACLPLINYVGIVPLAVQALYGPTLLWRRPERRWAVLDAGIVAILALLPSALWAMPRAVTASRKNIGISWIPTLSLAQVPQELHRFLGALTLGYRPSGEAPEGILARFLALAYAPCLLAVLLLLTVSLLQALRRSPWTQVGAAPRGWSSRPARPEVVVYLAVWLTAPVIGALAYTLLVRPVWGPPRYLFAAAPALVLWLAAGSVGLRRRSLAIGLAIALLGVNGAMIAYSRIHPTRTPWREIASTIADVAMASAQDEADGIMVTSLHGKHNFDAVCLDHAIDHSLSVPTPIWPSYVSLEQALERGRPFVIVMVVYMGPTHPGGMRADVERAASGYACRQLYSRSVFQEPYTAMPTPYMRHSVEVWLCSPPSAANKARAGGPPANELTVQS